MAETNRCPTCDCELPPDAPAGLCPACLLKAGLTSDHVEPGTKSNAHAFSAPSPAELAPHFPQLEILELIGQGGMGAVYKAKQIRLDRIVALKVLPKDAERGQEFADRFNREAKAMARLSHPNIIAIHDYGEAGGWFYFVMEFVDGVNMRQAMKSEPIKPNDALAVVTQICDALQYAHEENVVHRDIKPENILLTRKGKVKIADFGLAKLLGMSPMDRHLTATQQVMGTIGYMAPEQMEGSKAVDHRADIYALGVVFYELLTGELPMGRFAPPSQKVQVDIRIDEVVLKSLEREPSRRYQSASQIKHEVERISAGPATVVSAVPVTAPNALSTRLTWLGMVLLTLGIVELAAGLASVFSLMDVMHRQVHARDASHPMVQLGYGLVWVDFIGLSVLVVAAGLLILFRRLRVVAILGSFAAMLPFATVGAMIVPNRAELMRDFNLIQWLGVAGIPLGVWGLVELIRPETMSLFRWPVLPLLATVWRFLYPRFLNSTLLTTVACAFFLAVMMGTPWSVPSRPDALGSALRYLRVSDDYRYFTAFGEGTAAVGLTASTIIFLIVTWSCTLKSVAWRPIITLFGGLAVLALGVCYASRFPRDPREREVFEVGLYATFWAGGILCLNGAWRLSRWFARERPLTPHATSSATNASPIRIQSQVPVRRRVIMWLAASIALIAIVSLVIWIANGPGFMNLFGTELVQTGTIPVQAGRDGQVNFVNPYERPPNIRFINQPFSDQTGIVDVTTNGFRWKNYATDGPEALFSTRDLNWEARGERKSNRPAKGDRSDDDIQSGTIGTRPGTEGDIKFDEPFGQAPEITLSGLGSQELFVTRVTAWGFHFEYSKNANVNWPEIKWTARGKKMGPGPPRPSRLIGTWSSPDSNWTLKFHPDKKFDEWLPDGKKSGEYEMTDGASFTLISAGTFERITRQYRITKLSENELTIIDRGGPGDKDFQFQRTAVDPPDEKKP